jgi:hypothetical protein
MALAPLFGPLSANDPALDGLSKLKALSSIRNRIRLLIKELAPPRPAAQPPHDPLCQETGPWLWLGTGDRMHAARWYQTVRFLISCLVIDSSSTAVHNL